MVSIDMELAWGFNFELLHGSRWARRFLKLMDESRECIAGLLGLFEEKGVPATWAVVGHLLLDHCQRIDGIAHLDMPRPHLDIEVDWYALDPGTTVTNDPLWYAPDLVNMILDSNIKHELASHSFSHVDFSMCSREVALAEVRKTQELMRKLFNVSPKTFIFPKSRIAHLDVLEKEGLISYRGVIPQTWVERQLKKLSWLAYEVLRSFKSNLSHPPITQYVTLIRRSLVEVPGSLLFQETHRVSANDLLKSSLRALRKISETKGIFHIVLHDYSLVHPATFKAFTKLLSYVNRFSREHRIRVLNIEDLTTELFRRRTTL